MTVRADRKDVNNMLNLRVRFGKAHAEFVSMIVRADAKDEEKFRELQSKDRDMQGFIDGFGEKKAASEQRTADAQQNIVTLLEKISMVSTGNLWL